MGILAFSSFQTHSWTQIEVYYVEHSTRWNVQRVVLLFTGNLQSQNEENEVRPGYQPTKQYSCNKKPVIEII